MKDLLLKTLISALLGMLSEKRMRDLVDWILDFAENAALESENKWDDVVILSLCGKIRTVFGVPDNDPPKVVVVTERLPETPSTESEAAEDEAGDKTEDAQEDGDESDTYIGGNTQSEEFVH